MPEFYMIFARIINNIFEFCLIFVRKIYKNSRIFHDIIPKMPELYMVIVRKYISRFFFWGGGEHVPPVPCLLCLWASKEDFAYM